MKTPTKTTQYSPLNTTFSTRDGQQGGTLVVPLIEVFTVVLIRRIITVQLSITAQGLADAAPWRDDETVSLTQMSMNFTPTHRERTVQVVIKETCPILCR